MKHRNDGSMGKTAAEIIAEDATRDNRSNPDSYRLSIDYDGDEGDLSADDIEDIDDDFLDNDDFIDEDERDDIDQNRNR